MPTDISPVLPEDPTDIRWILTCLIHWADSNEVRLKTMQAVDFPVDDMQMFLVVNQLTYRGALRPTELAQTLGTGKANMSKIISRLEQENFVTKVPSNDDKRSLLVALTDRGREIGARIIQQVTQKNTETFADWSAEDQETFRTLLRRFAMPSLQEIQRRSPALHKEISDTFE